VLARAEVRAVPVEADEIARLGIERDGQAVAAGPRVADDRWHVLVVPAAHEGFRADRDVRLRDAARAPGDVAAAPPAVDLRHVVRAGGLLPEADELLHRGERLLAEGARLRGLRPLGDPLLRRGGGLRHPEQQLLEGGPEGLARALVAHPVL